MAYIQLSLFGKTCQERFLQMTGWILEPCWNRSQVPCSNASFRAVGKCRNGARS